MRAVVIGGLLGSGLCALASAQQPGAWGEPGAWAPLPGELPAAEPAPVRRDPELLMLERVLRDLGPDVALFAGAPPEQACVMVQTQGALTSTQQQAWRALGATPHTFRSLEQRGFGALSLPWHVAAHGPPLPGVIRYESCWQPLLLAPLEVTTQQAQAQLARQRPQLPVSGEGVLVADIDSGVDVLHPALFFADGARHTWVDQNEDGIFDAGRDGIDFDGDGKLESNEFLRTLLRADVRGSERVDTEDAFHASQDWLYLDRNRDRARNAGVTAGFLESDPGYGEPLFVVEDVNENGMLDVGEHVVMLKTSKVRSYQLDGHMYVRGEDLIESASAPGHARAFHGTGVAGIVVGGQQGFHERVGMAPGAELMMLALNDLGARHGPLDARDDHPLALMQRAQEAGADVLMHEWANPFTRPLDGSTLMEAAMMMAEREGLTQILPTGNLHGSSKHTEVTVAPQATLVMQVPQGEAGAQISTLLGSMQWREGEALTLALTAPDGGRVEVLTQSALPDMVWRLGEANVAVTFEVTGRQTRLLRFYIFTDDKDLALTPGEWRWDLAGDAGRVVARVTDYHSSWSGSTGWKTPSTGALTLSFPSSAQAGLRVGAQAGRWTQQDEAPGAWRAYSGRGDTLDGRSMGGVLAPDDPFVPLALTPATQARGAKQGFFITFGGTSGAGAHVAGAAALLLEQQRRAPQELFEALTAHALAAQMPGVPGALDVYAALAGERAPGVLAAPTLDVQVSQDLDAQELILSATTQPEQAQVRFDLEHDGEFEIAWGEARDARLARDLLQDGVPFAHVQARNAQGKITGVLVPRARWEPAPPGAPGEEGGVCECAHSHTPPAPPWFFGVVTLALVAWRRRLRWR